MTTSPAIRAPVHDGGVVVHPSWEEAGRQLSHAQLPSLQPIPGHPLPKLAQQVRSEVLTLAREFMTAGGEPLPALPAAGAPMVVAGHQPELFHPGVWVKNFALQGLARRHQAVALNLIIDNDIVKSNSIRLPHPSDRDHPFPCYTFEAFDSRAREEPYEEQVIHDPDAFLSFGRRVTGVMEQWGYQPLLKQYWPRVLAAHGKDPHPGSCFAGVRRQLEREWGCHNLEVPFSRICEGKTFAIFLEHILGELPRFHAIYNETVARYRRLHGIRSRNHPVPDLKSDMDWLEAPFWGWKTGENRRGRIFARRNGQRIELRCDQEVWPDLDTCRGADYKIRTRALTTTLFSRLLLADLFIHGIGGGKYDELTDEIAKEFYGIPLPPYLILSATRLLPLSQALPLHEDRSAIQQKIRSLDYHPERWLGSSHDPDIGLLIREKKEWVNRITPPPGSNYSRHIAIRDINISLARHLESQRRELARALDQADRSRTISQILKRRDYSFVLYPEEILKPFCQQFLRIPPT